ISSSETVMPKRRYARSSSSFRRSCSSGRTAGQPPASLLPPVLLEGRLILLLERLGAYDGAVHFEDDVLSAAYDIGDLSVRHPTNEGDRHHPEDRLRDLAHRAHHMRQNSCESIVGRGISLKTTTRKLKRAGAIPIDSAPEQTLSLSNCLKHLGRGLH